jgi:hypothetical protein
MPKFPVQMSERVLKDQRKRPEKALAEAVWNALDVGADHVTVSFEYTEFEAISEIIVTDDGAGMSREAAERGFKEYGDSWKRATGTRTHNGRTIHGQRGQGRYDILSLGTTATWSSTALDLHNRLATIKVQITGSDPKNYDIAEDPDAGASAGTTLRVSGITVAASNAMSREGFPECLTPDFAIYLRKYPAVVIQIEGTRLDPSSLHKPAIDVDFAVEGMDQPVTLVLIEWNKRFDGSQRIYLCDANGAALLDVAGELPSRDIAYTAYICWDGFKNPDSSAYLAILGGDDLGAKVFKAGKDAALEQLALIAERKRGEALSDWKEERSYPYEGQPKTQREAVTRKSFDVIAVEASPVLSRMNVQQRKFSMNLMRIAVETDPSAVQKVMREVLRLPEPKVKELAELFERTSLESMITATHMIADRLDFLESLKTLVFDAESKKKLLERTQLHKMLERETWLFGDQWTLTASDQTLRRVLLKHLKRLGQKVGYADVMPAAQQDGTILIPDLVLSVGASSYAQQSEYLVVELKRPSVTLGKDELDQIEGYAIAITSDEQFNQVNISWDFWLIGNDYDDYVSRKLAAPNMPRGCAIEDSAFRVHVRTWAEIIRDAEHRHKFIRDSLEMKPDESSGIAYLNRVHQELIPEALRDDGPTLGQMPQT